MKKRFHYSWSLLLSLTAGLTLACSGNGSSATQEKAIPEKPSYDTRYQETATLAGGCFWCIEAPLQELEGVLEVISGYTGGKEKNPTYEQVASGQTGHYEAVQVTFDPEVISYAELLDVFWQQFDPTDAEAPLRTAVRNTALRFSIMTRSSKR
ncbi:peptide methionine sulfoxide reductase [Nitritalea halalkaliphila LW7]|uniref:peptide-methionine (S)-S-oxide reductase n=1 Tax=Nitritalea halalkaliphila LW7 TaxID=1189621 RepID=I5C9R0_9BACT|nr:peptide-methionine (S)-S-oxide reductase MsrA [Nitritalea halalkaliphila]EIM78562.1 peptide methionine sulfoxide reductase [Nitritalea halalkaliphila LW7]